MISRFPTTEIPTSTYELSRLEREAEAFEREGKTQEAAVLRTTIHTLRVLMDEMKVPPPA